MYKRLVLSSRWSELGNTLVNERTGIVRSVSDYLVMPGDPAVFVSTAVSVEAGKLVSGALAHPIFHYGAGLTREEAVASACGEAMKHYCNAILSQEVTCKEAQGEFILEGDAGLAVGESLEQASVRAVYEKIGVHALAEFWRTEKTAPSLDWMNDPLLEDFYQEHIVALGVEYRLLDLSEGSPVPVVLGVMIEHDGRIQVAVVCDLNVQRACQNVLIELAKRRIIASSGAVEAVPWLFGSEEVTSLPPWNRRVSPAEEWQEVLKRFHEHGLEVGTVDLTTVDVRQHNLFVVRAYLPGLANEAHFTNPSAKQVQPRPDSDSHWQLNLKTDNGRDLYDLSEQFHESTKLNTTTAVDFSKRTTGVMGDLDFKQAALYSFKSYRGAAVVPLPMPTDQDAQDAVRQVAFGDVLQKRRTVRDFDQQAFLTQEQLSVLLYHSYGITGCVGNEETGRPVLLRAAPSAGGMYPCEIYLMVHQVEGVEPGLYHYNVRQHALECMHEGNVRDYIPYITASAEELQKAQVLLFLTAVFPRSEYKYGLRGYRFALQDSGHLAQNLMLASAAVGLGTYPCGGYFDDTVNYLLSVDGVRESVVYEMAIGVPEKNRNTKKEIK